MTGPEAQGALQQPVQELYYILAGTAGTEALQVFMAAAEEEDQPSHMQTAIMDLMDHRVLAETEV